MRIPQPFMIIPDFEIYRDESNKLKPYSFAIFTHCMLDKNKNKLTQYTGKNTLDNFSDQVKEHVNYNTNQKSKSNAHSNPTVYNSNPEFATFLICNKEINDQ